MDQPAQRISRRQDHLGEELCEAAAAGDLGAIERLLGEGASPDGADEDGTTALIAAVQGAQAEVVDVLLEAGADPDLQDAGGQTALMSAIISSGEMDLDGAHPLYMAIVERLLEADADVEVEDEEGSTAADQARAYGLDEMLELLGEA